MLSINLSHGIAKANKLNRMKLHVIYRIPANFGAGYCNKIATFTPATNAHLNIRGFVMSSD